MGLPHDRQKMQARAFQQQETYMIGCHRVPNHTGLMEGQHILLDDDSKDGSRDHRAQLQSKIPVSMQNWQDL